MGRLTRIAVAAVAFACLIPTAAGARTPALSASLLVARMTDPAQALKPLGFSARLVMPSSHDRNGGNQDGGSSDGPLEQLGELPPTIVRKEAGGYVLMEFHQPGCLVRTYMAGGPLPPGETNSFGHLQIFIDGQATPSYDRPASDLFGGKDLRYPPPLVGDAASSSGGNFAMVPFCFQRSLKVRTTTLPIDALDYWQADVLLVPQGTKVVPYTPALDLRDAAKALAHAADPPAGAPSLSAEKDVPAGSTLALPVLHGAGTVRRLGFTVRPFDIATLNALTLQVTVDGGHGPQISVPLAGMFGDTVEARKITAKAFGMDPAKGTGYLNLPIPYDRRASVSVVAQKAAHVRIDLFEGPPPPRGAGTLYGEHHVSDAPLGEDTKVLDAAGSGRLVSLVDDDLDGGLISGIPELQRFLEGDERVEVDGARSPVEYGTGHEENFDGGYYYLNGAFSGLFGGAGPLGMLASGDGTQSQYRVYDADGQRWNSHIAYGIEHGGGDEQPDRVGVTTFSYRARSTLTQTDAVDIGDPASEDAHRSYGTVSPLALTAFFEGEHDGNTTYSTVATGGTYYLPTDPSTSPEAVSAVGVRFTDPIAFTLHVNKANQGVVLRGLFDQGPPLGALDVTVDGQSAGIWASPTAVPNPSKRWLEDDYSLPVGLTRGKRSIRVSLAPAAPATSGDLYGLKVFSRSAP